MRRVGGVAGLLAFTGLMGAIVAALVLPWAHYGGIEVELYRLPGWGFYGSSAALLQLCVVGALRVKSGVPGAVLVGVVAGITTAVAAAVVTFRYDDNTAIFGHIVPPIRPLLGLGGLVAIFAALASTAAILVAARANNNQSRQPS